MQTVNVSLTVPKESKEVIDGTLDLIEDIRAKKDVGAIVSENLSSLMTAVDGYDQLGAELSSKERSDLAGYMTKRIMDVLFPTKEESEQPAE